MLSHITRRFNVVPKAMQFISRACSATFGEYPNQFWALELKPGQPVVQRVIITNLSLPLD
jgi:hypothetical protein